MKSNIFLPFMLIWLQNSFMAQDKPIAKLRMLEHSELEINQKSRVKHLEHVCLRLLIK